MAKIALSQINVIPKQPSKNVETMLREIELAKNDGIELIVFPEMSVPGYLIGDLYDDESFVRNVDSYTTDLVLSSKDIAVAFGTLTLDDSEINRDGRIRKYNSVVVAQNQQLVGVTHKTLLPNYRFFDDQRYFHPSSELAREVGMTTEEFLEPLQINLEGKLTKVGFMLCEDMWGSDYFDKPTQILAEKGAEFIVNLSCSPWGWRKNDKRHRVVKELGSNIPLFYVNNVGMQNNGKNIITFDGASTIYDSSGEIVMQATHWQTDTVVFDRQIRSLYGKNIPVIQPKLDEKQELSEIYSAITMGLQKFIA